MRRILTHRPLDVILAERHEPGTALRSELKDLYAPPFLFALSDFRGNFPGMVKRAGAYVTPATLPTRAEAWLAEVRAAVRPRPHLVVDPRRCALLVVDLVRYFAHPDGDAWLPAVEAILPNVLRLTEAWRRAGGLTVYTRHGHDGPHDLGMLGLFYSDYIEWETPAAQLVDVLTPGTGDLVLRKRTYDAFHGTDLEQELRSRGIDQVLVAGVLTHMCCATTARSAFVRGFETYLAVDATASSTEEFHRAALLTLADSVAILHSTDEVLARCAAT
jgi:bifunctional isochorismate lyase/aryl carrier protein